ncbi:type III secretion system inner membrane ring lipoprotein SctJ [Bradyrhizobium genosp. P]|uniref:type III secretion system inner membrane ring lipoprotein SctJ n=1 Tax=Bradyrhizobium genosp. P TaxID=83641 RepID=UPI003CF2A739
MTGGYTGAAWLKQAVILLVLFTLTGCERKIELYHNLPARDANEMLALLMRHGIDAERIADHGGAASLVIPTKDVPDAMNVLDSAGWPRDRFSDLGTLFKKEGLISSPTEERVRFVYGTTQELSETLSRIDGVLNARVHSVLPESESDDRLPGTPPTAAVLIRYMAGAPIDQAVPKIKELVANSLKGVSYDRVSVTLVEATQDDTAPRPHGAATFGAEGSDPPYLVVGLVGAIATSLIGNAVLAFFVWRERFGHTPA